MFIFLLFLFIFYFTLFYFNLLLFHFILFSVSSSPKFLQYNIIQNIVKFNNQNKSGRTDTMVYTLILQNNLKEKYA